MTDMIISGVHSTQGTRQGNLFCVEFKTNNAIHIKDVLVLEYEDKKYYFEVIELYTYSGIDCPLQVKALNVGYYNLFSKIKFDIRSLLEEKLSIVTDKEVLYNLNKEKCYC